MKLIIHIGTEKTGSTSIQYFLNKNQAELQKHGFYYLQSVGQYNHQELASFFRSSDQPDDFYNNRGIESLIEIEKYKQQTSLRLNREIGGLPDNIHTVITSSEHFHSRTSTLEEISSIKRYFSKSFSEFKILCYLRPQSELCASFYSTMLKSGQVKEFHQAVSQCYQENIYYNYEKMLENWEKVFGFDSLSIHIFSKDLFYENNLLKDFAIELKGDLIGNLNFKIPIFNVSLSYAGQVLLKEFNRLDLDKSVTSAPIYRKIIFNSCLGKGQQIAPNFLKKIKKEFEGINETIRRKFFVKRSILFDDNNEINKKLIEIDRPEFMKVLLRIFHEQNIALDHPNLMQYHARILKNLIRDLMNRDLTLAYYMQIVHDVIFKNSDSYHKKLSKVTLVVMSFLENKNKDIILSISKINEMFSKMEKETYGKKSNLNRQKLKAIRFSQEEEDRIQYYLGDMDSRLPYEKKERSESIKSYEFLSLLYDMQNEKIPKFKALSILRAYHLLPRHYSFRKVSFNLLDNPIAAGSTRVIVKAKKVGDSSVSLINVPPIRHFGMVSKVKDVDIDFEKKKSMALWRGATTGDKEGVNQRELLIETYFEKHPQIDVGFSQVVQKRDDLRNFVKNQMSLKEMLEYKYLISLEGNDVSSGLSWQLYSNSVVLMPQPRFSSWLMHDRLKPYEHYIPLQEDLNDLDEKIDWAEAHQEKCVEISANGKEFIGKFLNVDREVAIECEVLKRYLDQICLHKTEAARNGKN
jgi:hypothetical protein